MRAGNSEWERALCVVGTIGGGKVFDRRLTRAGGFGGEGERETLKAARDVERKTENAQS